LSTAYRSTLPAHNSTIERQLQAGQRFDSAYANFKAIQGAYVKVANSDDRLRARQMIEEVDAAWARLTRANDELIEAGRSMVGATRAVCAAASQVTSAGCNMTVASKCAGVLDGQTSSLGDALSRSARLSRTWRTAADEQLLQAKLEEPCPVTAAAAPRATITEATGRVFIQRGVRAMRAAVGTELLIGDVVVVEEGSAASLNLFGGGLLKISEKTKFEIPNPVTAPPPPGILAQAWRDIVQAYKEHAEAYEYGKMIKVPTATCGVRG